MNLFFDKMKTKIYTFDIVGFHFNEETYKIKIKKTLVHALTPQSQARRAVHLSPNITEAIKTCR